MHNLNKVHSDSVQEVKSNQIAVYISRRCDEAIIIKNDRNAPFGVSMKKIKLTHPFNIEQAIKNTYPGFEIVYLNEEAYFYMEEGMHFLPIGLHLEEIVRDNKHIIALSKIVIVGKTEESKYENEC